MSPKATRKTANQAAVEGWRKRLQEILDREGYTQRALSLKAGLGPTAVRHMIVKAEDAYLQTLAKVADAAGVDIAWLAAGAVVDTSVHKVPVWSAAGLPANPEEPGRAQPVGHLAINAPDFPDDVQAIQISDESMTPEGQNSMPPLHTIVLPGDVVLFSPGIQAESGRLVVARGPRGAMVRRLQFTEDGKIALLSLHHLFPKVTITTKQIAGAVVAVHRKLR